MKEVNQSRLVYGVIALALIGTSRVFGWLRHLIIHRRKKPVIKYTTIQDTIKEIAELEKKLKVLRSSIDNDVSLEKRSAINIFNSDIACDPDVFISVGPVIGKVTSSTAIVLLEINLSVQITVHLIPNNEPYARKASRTQGMPKDIPKAFYFENLTPNTIYNVVLEGVNARDAQYKTGRLRTMMTAYSDNDELQIVALSCNNPVDLRDKETNMWDLLAKQVKKGDVDLVLHVGDQVYGWKEFEDAQAILRYSGIPRGAESAYSDDPNIKYLCDKIRHRIRDIYRFTWNLPGTNVVLSHCSNIMIWSDNDIYNDFTIAKQAGEDGIEPIMLHLAHQVYREYQRQLWDINYDRDVTTNEFHYHRFGHTGIFMHDMRGNRITSRGEQRPDNPFMNEFQWSALDQLLADPAVKNLFICAEIPFVGSSPEDTKKGALNPKTPFLSEHWAYSDKELVRLFESVFNWKAQNKDERDIIFIGGDIHVGVTTEITDAATGIKAIQFTSGPMSSRVSPFFCGLKGEINERFSYTHVPLLNCRNYAYLHSKVSRNRAKIDGKLIAGDPIGK